MLKPPRISGAAQLDIFVHELGFDQACKVIDVHPATMRRWLRGATPVPQAPLQALYWLTQYGYSAACAEAHWTHQHLAFKVRDLERRLRATAAPQPVRQSWRARVPGIAANTPFFDARTA